MRPILSATNTYNYPLAKWLEEKLKPLSTNAYMISDIFQFSEDIRNIPVDVEEKVVVVHRGRCTILDRDRVDEFLQHLNSQQPSIRFTMEIENNSKIAFLDTSVYREPDGRLNTNVYRKPTNADQYLAYDSHHPQSVKRGIVTCLYDRAKRLVTESIFLSRVEGRG